MTATKLRRLPALLAVLLPLLGTANGMAQYEAVLFDATGAAPETRLLAMTLAGIVNRDSARLYLLNAYETWSYTSSDEQWRDEYRLRGGVVFDSIATLEALVARFRSSIRGAVVYDSAQRFSNFPGQLFQWQAEYAALIGSLTDRVPATPWLAARLGLATEDSLLAEDVFDGDAPVWVPGSLAGAAHPWNAAGLTDEQRYLTMADWGVRELLPLCNPSAFYIREITDFAVQRRLFQVNLAGTGDLDLTSMPTARADMLERILAFMQAKNPANIFHIYGWIRPEPMTQWFACFGASFHETLLGNLSWHSAFPVADRTYAPPSHTVADTVQLRDRYYLLFVASEGDASNWNFSFQSGAWRSPERGTVAIGWGWNLHLLSLCPFVAAYYVDTATPADGFLSVTSPLGYAYPDLWPAAVLDSAVIATRTLMARFGVRTVYGYKHYAGSGTMVFRGKTISNSFDFPRYGQFQSAAGVDLSILYDPLLPSQQPVTGYGPLLWNHTGDGSFYGNASDLAAMAARILAATRDLPRPAFLLAAYQRFRQDGFAARPSPGSSDISVPRLRQVVDLIRGDAEIGPYVEVVTPETFAVLLRQKLGITGAGGDVPLLDLAELLPNYPNPFNGTTTIRASIPRRSHATLEVFDRLGRRIRILADGVLEAGEHTFRFEADNLASGVYFCRLRANDRSSLQAMLLLK